MARLHRVNGFVECCADCLDATVRTHALDTYTLKETLITRRASRYSLFSHFGLTSTAASHRDVQQDDEGVGIS